MVIILWKGKFFFVSLVSMWLSVLIYMRMGLVVCFLIVGDYDMKGYDDMKRDSLIEFKSII